MVLSWSYHLIIMVNWITAHWIKKYHYYFKSLNGKPLSVLMVLDPEKSINEKDWYDKIR